ncbi:MAG: hypothetical protein HQK84_04035 [Nitrospinae bacterium]|nr:hypothetical protein [Nitrospinota bacterium]
MILQKRQYKKILLAGLLPLLLVFGVYYKNLTLTGKYTVSSWLGMNLHNVITLTNTPEEKWLIKVGTLVSSIRSFSHRKEYKYYLRALSLPDRGIPVIDQRVKSNGEMNFNSIEYLYISKLYMAEAIKLIKKEPQVYLRNILLTTLIYFHPSNEGFYYIYGKDPEKDVTIKGWDTFYNHFIYGQFSEPFHWYFPMIEERDKVTTPLTFNDWFLLTGKNVAIFVVAAFFLILLYNSKKLYNAFTEGDLEKSGTIPLLYLFFNLLYVTLVSILFEAGENARFRFLIEPLMVVNLGIIVTSALTIVRKKIAKDGNSSH